MSITRESVPVLEPDSIENLQLGEAVLRHTLYRFFASLHLYPNRDRLLTLQNVSLELQHAGPHWSDPLLSNQFTTLLDFIVGMDEESFNNLEGEYVALFSVNPFAPPYESYYEDPEGFVRSWIIIQLEKEYAGAGLNITSSFKEPPDHVAIELEFMAFLCSLEANAHETNNENDIKTSVERQHKFLNSHLGKWYPEFAQAVTESPAKGLYNLTIEVTNAFLQHETS